MDYAVLIKTFDVSSFSDEFLHDQIDVLPKGMEKAYHDITQVIKRKPISSATFGINTSSGPCICLELFYDGPDGKLHSTNRFVAYQIRNQNITPVAIRKMSTVSSDIARQ